MRLFITAYISAAICMLVLDMVWLTLTAQPLYRAQLGDLFRPDINMTAAGLFYLIYVFGIVYLAVLPNVSSTQWTAAAVTGAVLGFVAYATYDLTNQATLVRWSTTITIADMCWGAFITAASATAGYFGARAFGGV